MEEPIHRLRWKLCKIWGVPVDSDVFQQINAAQWLWYYHNYTKDIEEEFERRRNLVEYHASFIEPDAVRKVREMREKAIEIDDDDFSTILKERFGRDILSVQKPEDIKKHEINPQELMSRVQYTHHEDVVNKLYQSDWLNMNLEQ